MNRTALLAAAMTAALAFPVAQAANEPADTSAMPAPVEGVDTNAPLEGENSYTETQVADLLTEHGFTEISGLALDEKGVWRGKATREGTAGDVAVDYRGNIVFNGDLVVKPE